MAKCEAHQELPDFDHKRFDPELADVLRGHCVYSSPRGENRDRKPVILMHEAFGLSAATADLARRLVHHDFAVYMPVLFGNPLPRGFGGKAANAIKMCIGREFTILRTNKTSRVTAWVRAFADRVTERHEGDKVGVIGMCLTAHVVFPLTYDSSVGAVVASQSAMPWTGVPWLGNSKVRRRSLCISPADVERITSAPNRAPVTALRFESDPISPVARLDAVHQLFPGAETETVPDPPGQKWSLLRPHSVLTEQYDPEPGSPTNQALLRVVNFLAANL